MAHRSTGIACALLFSLMACLPMAPAFSRSERITPVICYDREFPPEGDQTGSPASVIPSLSDNKCVFAETFTFRDCSPDIPVQSREWYINGNLVEHAQHFEWRLHEGLHEVTLTLYINDESFSATEFITVVDVFPVYADFEPSPAAGTVPLAVSFINRSAAYKWLFYWWDFGDGTTSEEREPRHIYEKPGTYAVCLSVLDLRDCKGVSKNAQACRRVTVWDVGASDCEGNLLQDPGFEAGDMTAHWDASSLSSAQRLLCSQENCLEGSPYDGTHWVRFYDRMTDDVLAFGQKLSLKPGRYLFSYWYQCSDQANGMLSFHLNKTEIDRLVFPEMHSGGGYAQRSVLLTVSEEESEQACLLEGVNPTLGGAPVYLDHFCLIPFRQQLPADRDNDWKISEKEAAEAIEQWQNSDTSLSEALRALYLFRKGEAYRYNEALPPPLCWEPAE